MAKQRINQFDIPRILHQIGINCYGINTFNQIIGDTKTGWIGFKTYRISVEQRDLILARLPQAKMFVSQAEYAPEIVKSLIAFPRKTQLFQIV